MPNMPNTAIPDLTANTGVNDANSVWGSDLLQTAESLGTSALNNALSNQTAVQAPGSSAPGQSGAPKSSASSWSKYLLPAGIVIALIVVVMFLRHK
jgi:hypothetical protein